VRLLESSGGEVLFNDKDLLKLERGDLLEARKKVQIIFQDPASSLNPRMLVKDIVSEGITSFNLAKDSQEKDQIVEKMLEKVGLGRDAMWRYPHEFSGGQRQRICIARALVTNPEFIVCDEATSALDVSVQASILNLLKELQKELGLTYLFITHDLSVVEYLSDRVAVMYLGQILEQGDTEEIFTHPKHPYTQALLNSAPSIDPDHRDLVTLGGDIPSPLNPPSGCRFHTRCPKVFERCKVEQVPFYPVETGQCRCFLMEKEESNG
jgi:oligopeptide/dipeptide ABC transporter ATP-binding protein